jgi:hypothetical protein
VSEESKKLGCLLIEVDRRRLILLFTGVAVT